MFRTARDLVGILTPAERLRGALLGGLMVIGAGVEVAGIVSIAPFLFVLGNPEIVQTNPNLQAAFERLGFADPQAFLVFLAAFSLFMLCAAAAFRALVYYLQYRYANMRRHSIAERLMKRYLREPYSFFVLRNSSDLAKTILSEVDVLIKNALIPLLHMFAYGVVAAAILALLLYMDVFVAIGVTLLVGGIYAGVFLSVRGLLDSVGTDRKAANGERYQAAAEVFGGIKELKVLGRERAYLDSFRSPSHRFSRHEATNETLAEVPKYLVEAAGFTAILLVSLYFLSTRGELGAALPVIGLYALAGFRLLPAMQKVYSGAARLRFAGPAVEAILTDIHDVSRPPAAECSRSERLPLRRCISLEEVNFRYPAAEEPALSAVTLVIPAGSFTGIVGATGAGKSTLTDVILGLLQPTCGKVLIDGTPLTQFNCRAWQNNIGYVPQDIFLADDTVARNIAFGAPPGEFNLAAVERAASLAQIHDFIAGKLPGKYETRVGERGARLSGGQRQRLGIARALYHDPDVIVLDEATTALDQDTEAEVLDAVARLAGRKTIIMVTHRLATLERCDQLIKVNDGTAQVSPLDTPDELWLKLGDGA